MTDEQNLAPEASDEVVQPAETAAPEAAESTQGQDQSQPAEAETPEEAQTKSEAEAAEQKSKSAERRERRKAREAELRVSEATAREAAEKAEAEKQALEEAMQNLPKPQQTDFADFEEYQAALSAYQTARIIDSREVQKLEAQAKAHFDQIEQVKAQKRQEDAQNWAAQTAEARTRYSDFDAVAFSDTVTITKDMANHIMQSDVAADVTYFLGKNPEIAAEIATLDEFSMVRAIGRLEGQVTAPRPKTTTEAPAPIAPIKGKATAAKDPAKMTMAEYKAARQAGKI